jgi:hypothetical protein
MASPVQTPQAAALATIRTAAQNNTATSSGLSADVYTAAGVSSVHPGDFLSAYNSALDSARITGYSVNTTAKLQTVVSAYNDLIALSRGGADVGGAPLTGAQFAAIGVTGVQAGSAGLHLLNDCIIGIGDSRIDTVAEVQTLATATKHIMAAAGGTSTQAAALTLQDFSSLGVTGVTAENLAQVQNVIHNLGKDLELATRYDVQAQIDAHLGTRAEAAWSVLLTAALYNTASATTTGVDIYAKAGVHGVDSSNLASINSALNSASVSVDETANVSKIQGVVDAYNAILHSADGVAGNTSVALTGAQYAKVGVTGISGTAGDGSALHLLNDTVDGLRMGAVDRVAELQNLANATNHLMASVGSNTSDVTLQDLRLLGISGVNASNLSFVQAALHTTTATAVDTHLELQNFVNAHHAVMLA